MTDTDGSILPNQPLYGEVVNFLHKEAELLDNRRFAEWVNLMAPDMTYRVPMHRERQRGSEPVAEMDWFDDDLALLRQRVSRLDTDFAYAEQPPSRTRHMITNVRVRATSTPTEFEVVCNILVTRAQGSRPDLEIFSGERRDLVRKVDGNWCLAKRTVVLDQNVIGTGSLGILL